MFTNEDIVCVEQEDLAFDTPKDGGATCAARHPSPQQNGNLQVDPEIWLPSPGMPVNISYFYNSFSSSPGPYGYGRTISTNLVLIASANAKSIRLIRGDGASVTYIELQPGRYGKGGLNKLAKVVLDSVKKEWVESGEKGIKRYYPVVSDGHESKVSRIVDAVGNHHTFRYDRKGLLTTLTDTVGRQVAFRYDDRDLLSEIVDWANRKTTFEYDVEANPSKPVMIKATGPTGCQTAYRYDPEGFLTGIVDPNGYETSYRYDADRRVVARVIAGVGETKFDYDYSQINDRRQYTVVTTDALGNKTSDVYTSGNSLVSRISPTGRVIVYETKENGGTKATFRNGRPVSATIRDKSGRVVTQIDAQGLKTVYTHDQFGNLLSTVLPTGATKQQIWGFAGSVFDKTGEKKRLQIEVDEYGNKTKHTYNNMGLRTSSTDAHGNVTRFTYDQLGNLVCRQDQTGAEWVWKHDAVGNVIVETAPDGGRTRYEYDARNRVTKVTDALGAVTRMAYDGNGNRTVLIDASGGRRRWEYNVWDKVAMETTPSGNVTHIEYDAAGRMVSITDPLGAKRRSVYNADGDLIETFDALGNRTQYQYDADGRQVAIIDPLGRKTQAVYNESGRQVGTVDAAGNHTTTIYDDFGRNAGHIDALGNKTTTEFDAYGRVSNVINALNSRISIIYAPDGRASVVVDALGFESKNGYDNYGRSICDTDPLGNKTQYEYDALNRLVATVDAAGAKTQYEYDKLGREIAVIDAQGARTVTEYSALGQKTAEIDPLGNRMAFAYNLDGLVTERSDGRGIVTHYTYDVLGRKTRVAYSNKDETAFEYDLNGNNTVIKDSTGETRYEYDPAGNRTIVHYPGGKLLRYAYDALNRRISMVDHDGGKTTYTYDKAGNLTSISNPFGEATNMSYDAVGHEVNRTFPNGMVETRVYDARGSETSRRYTSASSAVLASFDAEYDSAGNQTQVAESDGSVVRYAYDATRQLIAEERTGSRAYKAEYTYDALGNRLMMARNGAVTRYDYDAASGLASRTSPTGIVAKYAYDAGGNLASVVKGDADARYEWDGENRLVGITNGPKSRKYAYSAEGLRVSNATNDRSKRSLWDGVNLLAELDSSGATIVHYTDTPGTWGCLTSERRGDVSSHYIYDLSSNTRALVDNSGSIVAEYAYDAFGASLATTESAVTPYRFGGLYGYYSDDDDMVYVRARHYSTTHGRWISRDPLGFRGGDWNLHRYVGNRAVSEVDASGTNSGSCCATVRDDCNNKANKVIAYEQSIAAIMCPNGIPLKLAGGVAGCATLCKGKPACVAICSVLYLLACAAMSACVSARASAYATYCPEEYDYCAQGSKGTHPPRPNSVCGYSNNPATGSHYPGPDY